MLNVQLIYKPRSSWRILFWSGGHPSQLSCLKTFRDLVVPGGGRRKGTINQGILMPTGVLPNGQSFLRRKGGVMGASVHVPIQRNSKYKQMVRWNIYETR